MGYWAAQNATISQITLSGRANGEKLWREDGNGTKGAYMCDQAINLQVMDVTLSHAHREIKDTRKDGSGHPHGSYVGLPWTELF